MLFKADLHCHSTFSDGTLTPDELIGKAISMGMSGISITDHDNIRAYDNIGKYDNFRILPGVEFSCRHGDQAVHVLGYGFKLSSHHILDLSSKHKDRRRYRNTAILQALHSLGIDISKDEIMYLAELSDDAFLGRSHIARAMVSKGIVKDIGAAFKQYLGDGKPAFRSLNSFSVQETIDVIHRAGGLVVLAHPHVIKKRKIINDILKFDFDGIEGYYAHFNKDQEQRWIELAKKKGLFITGGSDFHGDYIKHNILGSSYTEKVTFDILWEHFNKQ